MKNRPLTAPDLAAANLKWIYYIQHTMFPKEIANTQLRCNCSMLVRQLRLVLDKDNLLHCGGRIHNAPISKLAKFPYLLPSRHYFTVLVILNAHATQLHSRVNVTITVLCQRYWILAAHQRIISIIHMCVVCKKTNGKPYTIPDPLHW